MRGLRGLGIHGIVNPVFNFACSNLGETWYLAGGIAPANCVAAYKPYGAADIATSKINLANPGTYDAVGTCGFDSAIGWIFNGTTNYLNALTTPDAANTTWTIIIQFSGCINNTGLMIGSYNSTYWYITPRRDGTAKFTNGSQVISAPHSNGVMAIAGSNGYYNGVDVVDLVIASNGVAALTIGRVNTVYYAGNVLSVAIYDTTLAGAQIASVTNAMNGFAPVFADPEVSPTEPEAGEFTVVYLSDSHIGSTMTADDMEDIFDYLRVNADRLNIQAILYGGDIGLDQLSTFETSLGNIENIPHVLAIGNHDYDTDVPRSITTWGAVFDQTYYTGKSWWSGGFCDAGKADNAYLLQTIEGVDYIFLSLEFFPRQAVIDWANTILTTYAARKAIIVTHAYEYTDNTPYSVGDAYGPTTYLNICGADYHWGDEIWTELIKLHDNIILVHSGHVVVYGRHVANSDGGQPVNQVLSNFQSATGAITGTMVRFMIVKPASETISVETFSPVLLSKYTGSAHQFVLDY